MLRRNRSAIKIAFAMFSLSVPMPSLGAEKPMTFSSTEGEVAFVAIGRPSILKINGLGPAPTGSLRLDPSADNAASAFKASGEFTFDLNGIDTGIELRNDHMRNKYLEVGKFRTAVLTLTDTSISGLKGDIKINSMLSLHGVTKPVAVTGEYDLQSPKPSIHAKFSAELSQFGIETPSYSGIKVADEVKVSVIINLKKEN